MHIKYYMHYECILDVICMLRKYNIHTNSGIIKLVYQEYNSKILYAYYMQYILIVTKY